MTAVIEGTITEATPSGTGDWIVLEGQTLDGIAVLTGHFRETLRTLQDNDALMKARADGDALLPGDRLTVPPIRVLVLKRTTGARYVFRRKGVPAELRYGIRKSDGTPLAGKNYRLIIGPRTYDGQTDENGNIHAWVEPLARTGTLTVTLAESGYPATLDLTLSIGTMWPIETVRGVQQRLEALQYACGSTNGVMDDGTRAAVAAFQRDSQLGQSGTIDQSTVDALRRAYGF